ATVTFKPKLSVASTLYADLAFSAKNNVDGTGKSFGVRMSPESIKSAALYFTHGEVSFGIEFASLMPQIGYMNLTVGPGGPMIGPFSLTEAPNLVSLALVFGWIVFESSYEVAAGLEKSASEFFLTLATRTIMRFTPYAALRNLVNQFTDTSNKSCDAIDNANDLSFCLMSSASYRYQGVRPVAESLVKSGLDMISVDKASEIDPYVRATLMEELDRTHFSGGTKSKAIAKNVEGAVAEANAFLKKHRAWIDGGEGKAPLRLETHSFLGTALYLLRKLQTSATVSGKTIEITGWTPIAFKDAQARVDFLKTVSNVYAACVKSDRLWDFMTSEIKENALAITEKTFLKSPEQVVGSWFRYKNMKELTDEIASPYIRGLFGLRKIHLIASLDTNFSGTGKELEQYKRKLMDVKLEDRRGLEEKRREAHRRLPELAVPVSFVSTAADIYNGLEMTLRLSDEKDELSRCIGIDCRNANDTPPYSRAFKALYDLELLAGTNPQGRSNDEKVFISALRLKARHLLELVLANHRGRMEAEIKGYKKAAIKRIAKLYEALEKLPKLIEDPVRKAQAQRAIEKMRFDLMCRYVNEEILGRQNPSGIIAGSTKAYGIFEKTMKIAINALLKDFDARHEAIGKREEKERKELDERISGMRKDMEERLSGMRGSEERKQRFRKRMEKKIREERENVERKILRRRDKAKKELESITTDELDPAVGKARNMFEVLQDSRNAVVTMKSFIDEVKEGGADVEKNPDDKRHFLPGWRGDKMPFISIRPR
ncbi:MAG TPA: hypothetical protein PLZ86_07820, partial [bacterium]|nr:hypothetical protein [bacterium]